MRVYVGKYRTTQREYVIAFPKRDICVALPGQDATLYGHDSSTVEQELHRLRDAERANKQTRGNPRPRGGGYHRELDSSREGGILKVKA